MSETIYDQITTTFPSQVNMLEVNPFTGEDSVELEQIINEDDIEFAARRSTLTDITLFGSIAAMSINSIGKMIDPMMADEKLATSDGVLGMVAHRAGMRSSYLEYSRKLFESLDNTAVSDIGRASRLNELVGRCSGISTSSRRCMRFHDLVSVLNAASSCFGCINGKSTVVMDEDLLTLIDKASDALAAMVVKSKPKNLGYCESEQTFSRLKSASDQLITTATDTYATLDENKTAALASSEASIRELSKVTRQYLQFRYGIYFTKCATAAIAAVSTM